MANLPRPRHALRHSPCSGASVRALIIVLASMLPALAIPRGLHRPNHHSRWGLPVSEVRKRRSMAALPAKLRRPRSPQAKTALLARRRTLSPVRLRQAVTAPAPEEARLSRLLAEAPMPNSLLPAHGLPHVGCHTWESLTSGRER